MGKGFACEVSMQYTSQWPAPLDTRRRLVSDWGLGWASRMQSRTSEGAETVS